MSKFRSSVGPDSSDDFESCRTIKHYHYSKQEYQGNYEIEVYSPVNGSIIEVKDTSHGPQGPLRNKGIGIIPDGYPAFTIEIVHVDLISEEIKMGKQVNIGELLEYATVCKNPECGNDFDMVVYVNTPNGLKMISYFNALPDDLFEAYQQRGIQSKDEFIIAKEERDANTLNCEIEGGYYYIETDPLIAWVVLD